MQQETDRIQELWNKPDARKILRILLENLAEGVIIADRSGKFIFFNSVAEKILGIGSRDVAPSEWTSLYGCFYPDQKTPYPAEQLPLALAIQGEEINEEVIFIKNPVQAKGIYISVSASPLKESNGVVNGGIIIFRDITESLRAEAARKQSEERLRAQFRGLPIPTYVWRRIGDDFFLVDFNDAALSFIGVSIKKLAGSRFTTLYKNFPEVQEDFRRCFSEKRKISREISYRKQSSGERKELVVTFAHIPPDLVMVNTEDITERKRTEKELLKLSGAVEQTADGILITDSQGIIEYVNPAFTSITGYSREEVIGQNPRILNSGKQDKAFYDNLWKAILSGKPYRTRLVNKKKNGQLFWCNETITPMKDKEGKVTNFVSVLKDISDQMEQEEQKVRMSVAREIQQRLYEVNLEVSGFEIAGETRSADKTSGDYFDYFQTPDGYIEIVVGDVSGHGIGAALIMTETRAYLRAFAETDSDPGTILKHLNRALYSDMDEKHFVTLILARLDASRHLMDYASAGHVPAYVLDGSGKIKYIMESTGIPLGFLPDFDFRTARPLKLERQEIVLLVSDGVTEAKNGSDEEFGSSRALEIISKYRHQVPDKILAKLHQAVLSFSDHKLQKDDITSVICKVRDTA